MCDNRDVKFVAPLRPSARMGWWIGQIVSVDGRFCGVNVMWAEVAEKKPSDIIYSTSEYVLEFNSSEEAMAHVQSQIASQQAAAV